MLQQTVILSGLGCKNCSIPFLFEGDDGRRARFSLGNKRGNHLLEALTGKNWKTERSNGWPWARIHDLHKSHANMPHRKGFTLFSTHKAIDPAQAPLQLPQTWMPSLQSGGAKSCRLELGCLVVGVSLRGRFRTGLFLDDPT